MSTHGGGFMKEYYTVSEYAAIVGKDTGNIRKLLINGEIIDALSIIVHRDFAYHRGQAVTIKLKELLPKQQFEIPILQMLQASILIIKMRKS